MPTNSFDPPAPAPRPTASRLLTLLKTRGPQTAGDLGAALDITGEAARQHLVKLAADGLVSPSSEPRGVGRPAQVWSLTEAGNARFPDTHAELTSQLIGLIRAELGEEALDRLISARAALSAPAYEAALEGASDLGERVQRLAAVRTREGYMAESLPEGDAFLLVENHCPICTAATTCQGFCRAELDQFRRVLGRGVSVEREEHIVGGDRRCAYRVALECVPPPNPNKDKKGRSS
jgi:predicted ArsR family transcriptional regulator